MCIVRLEASESSENGGFDMSNTDAMQVPVELGYLKFNFFIFSNARVDPCICDIPHNHINYELHCIASGSCTFTVNDQLYNVKSGDLLLIPPQEYHGLIKSNPSDDFSQYTFFFSLITPKDEKEELAQQTFTKFSQQNRLIRSVSSKIQDYCARINEEASTYRSTDSIYVRSSFCALMMIEILRAAPINTDCIYQKKAQHYSSLNRTEIDEFFDQNYQSNVKIQDLANYLNFSIRHTNTILNKLYGMSFTQKLYSKRLSAAKNQLIYSEATIAQICYDCGFQSHSFFNSSFRKQFNMTPSEFRKQSRKRQSDKSVAKEHTLK